MAELLYCPSRAGVAPTAAVTDAAAAVMTAAAANAVAAAVLCWLATCRGCAGSGGLPLLLPAAITVAAAAAADAAGNAAAATGNAAAAAGITRGAGAAGGGPPELSPRAPRPRLDATGQRQRYRPWWWVMTAGRRAVCATAACGPHVAPAVSYPAATAVARWHLLLLPLLLPLLLQPAGVAATVSTNARSHSYPRRPLQ